MGENKEYITHPAENGSISISEEVLAIIAACAVMEVDGVAGMSLSPVKDIAELFGKKLLSKKKIYFVGDCDQVGSLKTVIKQAYELVQKISY